jgi:ribonuclease P protein subunit POP4
MITKNNIVKHELIGLDMRVVSSSSNLTGLSGRVVDETKNLLVVATPKGEKKVPKQYSVFEFQLPEGRVTVEGDRLLFRPEDRIKKAR